MDAGQIPSSSQVMDGEAETIEKDKNSMKGGIGTAASGWTLSTNYYITWLHIQLSATTGVCENISRHKWLQGNVLHQLTCGGRRRRSQWWWERSISEPGRRSGLMQHATAVIRRLWVYEQALLCREVTGRVEELANGAAERVKRLSSNIFWQEDFTSTYNQVTWSSSLCVFLCPLTQKSLLLENVLIHISEERISRSVTVVVIVGGHAVSSFALQPNTDTETLFSTWLLCFHINILISCLTSSSPGHTPLMPHLCYNDNNNNNNNNIFIIKEAAQTVWQRQDKIIRNSRLDFITLVTSYFADFMLRLSQSGEFFNKCILSDENRTESINQTNLIMGQHIV